MFAQLHNQSFNYSWKSVFMIILSIRKAWTVYNVKLIVATTCMCTVTVKPFGLTSFIVLNVFAMECVLNVCLKGLLRRIIFDTRKKCMQPIKYSQDGKALLPKRLSNMFTASHSAFLVHLSEITCIQLFSSTFSPE